MLKLAPATEQFQHFVSNLRESFWGDLNGRTREAWKKFFEADSERQRDRFAVVMLTNAILSSDGITATVITSVIL